MKKRIIFCLVLVQHAISANQGFNPKLLPSFFALYDNQNKPPKQTIPAGTLDLTFGKGTGYVTTGVSLSNTVQNNITSMAVDQQNRYITVGSILKTDGDQNLNIALFRFLSDGTVDKGFGVGGYVIYNQTPPNDSYLNSVTVDGRNGIVAVGTVKPNFFGSIPVFYLMRYLDNGTIDDNFTGGQFNYGLITPYTNVNNAGQAVTIDSQGRIILVGYSSFFGGYIPPYTDCFCVVRYDSLGNIDTTFGLGMIGSINPGCGHTVYYNFPFPFTPNNIPYGVVTDSQDNIIVVGVSNSGGQPNLEVVKFLGSDGSIDEAFLDTVPSVRNGNPIIFTTGYSVAIDQQNRIVIGGVQYGAAFCLIRLLSDGSLDTSFGNGGVAVYNFNIPELGNNPECHQVLIDPLGRILMLGTLLYNTNPVFAAVRVLEDSSLDTSFGNVLDVDGNKIPGVAILGNGLTQPHVYSGALDQQGRIIVAGNNDDGQNDSLPTLVAFTTDYSFDYYKSQFNNQPVGFLA